MLENPWDVEYLEEYLVYSCPECRNLSQNEDEFLEHALENHPHSRQSLMRFLVKEEKKPLEFSELKEKLNKLFDKSKLEEKELQNNSLEVKTNDIVQKVMFGSNEDPQDDDPLAFQNFSQFEHQQDADGNKTLLCGNCKALFHSMKYLKIHTMYLIAQGRIWPDFAEPRGNLIFVSKLPKLDKLTLFACQLI